MSDQSYRQKMSEELDALEAELRWQKPGPFEPGEELGEPLLVRGVIIPVHLDRGSLSLINAAAKAEGLSRSEFIRRAAEHAAREQMQDGRKEAPFDTYPPADDHADH